MGIRYAEGTTVFVQTAHDEFTDVSLIDIDYTPIEARMMAHFGDSVRIERDRIVFDLESYGGYPSGMAPGFFDIGDLMKRERFYDVPLGEPYKTGHYTSKRIGSSRPPIKRRGHAFKGSKAAKRANRRGGNPAKF